MITARSWVVTVLIAVVGSGCKKANGADKAAGAEATADRSGQVLGLYVHCFNEVEREVHASWNSYTEWVDPKTGLTGKEKRIDGIDQINDYDTGKCLENLTTALANGAGSGPLTEPTKAYQAALTKLLPVVNETKVYYEHKDYKDDAFAKGKELHATLTAAFETWDKANTALRNLWDAQHRAQRDRDLAEVEHKLGRKSEQFVSALVMNTAEQLIETVTSTEEAPALKTAFAAYQAAFAEMDAFFGPTLTASTDTDRYMFKQSSDELLVQTKEAGRVLDAGKALPDDGDGSRAQLLEKYNNLVERSNSITWD